MLMLLRVNIVLEISSIDFYANNNNLSKFANVSINYLASSFKLKPEISETISTPDSFILIKSLLIQIESS